MLFDIRTISSYIETLIQLVWMGKLFKSLINYLTPKPYSANFNKWSKSEKPPKTLVFMGFSILCR